MSRRFTCPRGHIWYADPPPDLGDTTRVLPNCPSCGEIGELVCSGEDGCGVPTSQLGSDALVIEDSPNDTPPPELGMPPTLPGYELREEIGRGGMGIVYDAWDQKHGGRVAVKYLPRLEPSKVLRFKREFRALADLSHPNLAGVYELAQVDGRWFIVMERIEGEPFVEHLLSVPNLAERTRLLRPALAQLVEGIHHLHQAGLLHCDIKPSNVLVAPNGRVVLLDFGLVADWLPADSNDSQAELVGSLGYLAPERFAGKPPSTAGDWYAVGVMLYEVLTGQRPFQGTRTELIWKQRYLDSPPTAEVNPEVPAEWNSLCMALLQRDPAKRPDGKELLQRLRGSSHSAVHVSRTRETPLVGRDTQLEGLRSAFAAARAGLTTIACVRGESGMGKTTLVDCFLERLALRESITVLKSRCHRQESVPFKGVDGVVDALSQHLAAQTQNDLRSILPADIAALGRVFPVLRRIKLGPAGWKIADGLDPIEIRRRCLQAARELLTRMAARRPLVLDDMQWGDADSARLLTELLGPPAAPPVMMIACWRSEEESTSECVRLLKSSLPAVNLVRVELAKLTPLESESLAATLLAESAIAGEVLVGAIARAADGRPVHIHELARHYRSAPPEELVAPRPQMLEALISQRVRELPAAARRAVEVLAIAAHPLRLADARLAAELDSEPRSTWGLLRSRHLVRDFSRDEDQFVECYHECVREAVVDMLSPAQRAAVHDQLVRTFAAHRVRDQALLAVHCLGAGRTEEAADHYARAAAEAAEAVAFERAAQLYQLSLELHAPPPAQAAELRQKLADCVAKSGRGYGNAGES